jgi:hypothetical protein
MLEETGLTANQSKSLETTKFSGEKLKKIYQRSVEVVKTQCLSSTYNFIYDAYSAQAREGPCEVLPIHDS